MDYNGKNVIIFSIVTEANDEIKMMGSLFDSIEYYAEILKYNPDVHLLLAPFHTCNHEKVLNQLKDIIDQRYNYDFDLMKNIGFINLKNNFLKYHFNNVVTFDLGSPRQFKKFFVRANNVFIVSELTSDDYFYKSKINKVTYFSEMPFCYSDVPYKMKMAFQHFKHFDSFKNNLYINYPKADYLEDEKITNVVNFYNKPILVKDAKPLYDLHKHFDEYIYFQSDAWFDTHPRLFHESKFYKKSYMYYNYSNVKDGAYYRYYDSIQEPLKMRELTKDDEIVQRMI